jgi:hypothetical protein
MDVLGQDAVQGRGDVNPFGGERTDGRQDRRQGLLDRDEL